MVVQSLLENDLYKFTMGQVFFNRFADVNGKYRFKCRNADVNLLPYRKEIEDELDDLCNLSITDKEHEYLKTIRFFKPGYLEYLRNFKLNRNFIHTGERDGNLDIWCEGPIYAVSQFEIFVLKIVSEVYFGRSINADGNTYDELKNEGTHRLRSKIDMLLLEDKKDNKVSVVDFGTRRAYSNYWHRQVVKQLSSYGVIGGTSNVKLAMDFNLTPIGTYAHEFVQMFQGLDVCTLANSQTTAMQTWADEYRGDLGIALSDTLGDKKFIKDFDMYFAKLFDGVRHDSGDPYKWGDMMIGHYNTLRIPPKSKTLVFSDGLDVRAAISLHNYFKGQINVSFGIGTNLTNDLGVTPLQNVMKIVEVNGNPVAKLSNDSGKAMCESPEFEAYLRSVL